MPVFGNRMVVGTANYKHIQEHKAAMDQRETKLGEWEDEKRQRLARIRELNASTKVKIESLGRTLCIILFNLAYLKYFEY